MTKKKIRKIELNPFFDDWRPNYTTARPTPYMLRSQIELIAKNGGEVEAIKKNENEISLGGGSKIDLGQKGFFTADFVRKAVEAKLLDGALGELMISSLSCKNHLVKSPQFDPKKGSRSCWFSSTKKCKDLGFFSKANENAIFLNPRFFGSFNRMKFFDEQMEARAKFFAEQSSSILAMAMETSRETSLNEARLANFEAKLADIEDEMDMFEVETDI